MVRSCLFDCRVAEVVDVGIVLAVVQLARRRAAFVGRKVSISALAGDLVVDRRQSVVRALASPLVAAAQAPAPPAGNQPLAHLRIAETRRLGCSSVRDQLDSSTSTPHTWSSLALPGEGESSPPTSRRQLHVAEAHRRGLVEAKLVGADHEQALGRRRRVEMQSSGVRPQRPCIAAGDRRLASVGSGPAAFGRRCLRRLAAARWRRRR